MYFYQFHKRTNAKLQLNIVKCHDTVQCTCPEHIFPNGLTGYTLAENFGFEANPTLAKLQNCTNTKMQIHHAIDYINAAIVIRFQSEFDKIV